MGKKLGAIGAAWGLLGLFVLLGGATYRLSLMMFQAFEFDLAWHHWLIFVVNVGFMAYVEGYKGFQVKFAPRFAARVRHLRDNPTVLNVLLAPLFCMGYYHTTRRRLISVYVLTLTIIAFILGFQMLSQPIRGLLDAGVVIGLTWGMTSVFIFCTKALRNDVYEHSPELPEPAAIAIRETG
jgi:hypothetical protein